MSKIAERAMFLHPSIYSSDKFKIKQNILDPTTTPTSSGYYKAGETVQFNIGGAPNEFIIPESAYLVFMGRVTGTAVPAGNGPAAGNYTCYSVPKFDFGIPFFDQVNVTLDSSRNIANYNGAGECRTNFNGRVSCTSESMYRDIYDVETETAFGVSQKINQYTTTGPASLCGFVSETQRSLSYCGPAKEAANTVNYAGGVNYRIPLSLFHGLFDAQSSAWIPIGMLAQSSASGITVSCRLAGKNDVLQDSSQTGTIRVPNADALTAQKLANCFYGVFNPALVYRSIEVLDTNILAALRASFNGQNVEAIEMGGQVMNIPKLLNIKYRGFAPHKRIYNANSSSATYTISSTEPSLRGIMMRIADITADAPTAPNSRAVDPQLLIKRFQVRIGNSVYPLKPVEQVETSNFDPDVTNVNTASENAMRASGSNADAVLAGLQEDSTHLFAPWLGDSEDNLQSFSYYFSVKAGKTIYGNPQGINQLIKPVIVSFDNLSSYEKDRTTDRPSATGIDMRGIGSIQIDLSLQRIEDNSQQNPASQYDIHFLLLHDGILSVKRGSIDPEYQYSVY